MDPLEVLSLIGQGARIGTGLFSDIYSIWDSNRRFEQDLAQTQYSNQFAEKQFLETQKYNAFNQYLAENGTQVRAKDLAKAGLSKVLAAGSTPSYVTGSAGGSVNNHSFGQGLKINALMNAIQMNKEFQVKDQEIQLLKEQKRSAELDNDYKSFEIGYWKKLGIPSNADMWQRRGLGLFDTLKAFGDYMNSEASPNKTRTQAIIESFDKFLHKYDLDRYRPQQERIRYTPTQTDYIKNYSKDDRKYADQNDKFTYRDKYRYVQLRRGRY